MALNAPRADPPFAGDFDNLHKASFQLGTFACASILHCKRGRKLFLCSLDDRLGYSMFDGQKSRNSDMLKNGFSSSSHLRFGGVFNPRLRSGHIMFSPVGVVVSAVGGFIVGEMI